MYKSIRLSGKRHMMRKRQRRPMSAGRETLEVQQESIDAYHISRVIPKATKIGYSPHSIRWLRRML